MRRRQSEKTVQEVQPQVTGFLLDECVIGLQTHIQFLPDLPVHALPRPMWGRSDDTVHGIAYSSNCIIITSDSGHNDKEGFCTTNETIVSRWGVIFLPDQNTEANAKLLRQFESQIILYLDAPDRRDFYLDLSGADPVMILYGQEPFQRSLQPDNAAVDGGSVLSKSTGRTLSRSSPDIEAVLTAEGLHIISGNGSSIAKFVPVLDGADANGIQISITLHASSSPLLPEALKYLNEMPVSACRIKSCSDDGLEILSLDRRRINKILPRTSGLAGGVKPDIPMG